jgi:cytochrome c biogenesis protein CcmG, thiol:disulfide interchange protein DsbE
MNSVRTKSGNGSKSPNRAKSRHRARYAKRGGSSSRTWMVVLGVAVVAVIAAVIAFAAAGGDDGSGSSKSGSAQSGRATTRETGAVAVAGATLPRYTGPTGDDAVGDTIPTLTGQSFDGSQMTIGPTGAPQVVMFLAHWCPHCQAQVPLIVDLAKQGTFEGLGVSTVATGTNANYPNYPPSAWLESEDWPFPVMADSAQSTAAQAYGLPSYPFFVFVDADGKVAGRATGELSPDDLTEILDALRDGRTLPAASGASSSAT